MNGSESSFETVSRRAEMSALMERVEHLERIIEVHEQCREVQSANKQAKFRFIEEHAQEISVTDACHVLDVSVSGYYDWRNREESAHAIDDRKLGDEIQEIFERYNGIYGSPRIHAQLLEEGRRVSAKRVARLMAERGLSAKVPKKFVKTTLSNHDRRIADNVLDRRFDRSEWDLDEAWVGDITYIATGQGWMYLATLIDLVSKKVVGWSMADHMRDDLCIEALNDAISRRGGKDLSGLIHHTDRGSQYASDDYIQALKDQGMIRSMSKRGDCWDNSPAESFFATLKKECVHRVVFRTKREAVTAVTAYIEVFYNRGRKHSSIGYVSPDQFERMSN